MRRRDFVRLAGAAAAFPGAALAQQSAMKRLAFLNTVAETDPVTPAFVASFKRGLAAQGWSEGGNLRIDYRFGAVSPDIAMRAAKEAVDLRPDAIVAVGNGHTAALVRLTQTIPITFALVTDPVGGGFVQSYARPGGNITGFTNIDPSATEKWLQLLKELSPDVKQAALLVAKNGTAGYDAAFRSAALRFGLQPIVLEVGNVVEISQLLAGLASSVGSGLVISTDPLFFNNRDAVLAEVERSRIPTVFGMILYAGRAAVDYYIDTFDVINRAGAYAGLILNGTKPADLPVQDPTKFILSVNLKTAKATGITVPLGIVARADEVIE